MYLLKRMAILAQCILVICGCSLTNQVGHMMVDATENKDQENQSTKKEDDDHFISAPGLSAVQIDELWEVAIDTCYRLGYSVTLNDRKSNNLACQAETPDRKSVYTLRVWFTDKGIQVDAKSNSIANLLFGAAGTKHDHGIMMKALEDKLAIIYTQRGNYNRSTADIRNTYIYKAQQQLTELNYEPGPSDGIIGKRTQNSIIKFQLDNDITPTGMLDEKTIQKLNELTAK